MSRPGRRWAVPLLVAGTALLVGCTAEGSATLDGAGRATVDAVVTHPLTGGSRPGPCVPGGAVEGLSVEPLPSSSPAEARCRVRGTVTLAAVNERIPGLALHADGHYYLTIPLIQSGPLDRLDLDLTFPGDVVAVDDATAAGRTARVRSRDVSWSLTTGVATIVARDGSFRVDPLLAASGAVGLLVGGGAVAATRRIGRRPGGAVPDDGPAAPATVAAPDPPGWPAAEPTRAEPPEDPSVWAPDAGGRHP